MKEELRMFELQNITKRTTRKKNRETGRTEEITRWVAKFREDEPDKKAEELLTATILFDREPDLIIGQLYNIVIKE